MYFRTEKYINTHQCVFCDSWLTISPIIDNKDKTCWKTNNHSYIITPGREQLIVYNSNGDWDFKIENFFENRVFNEHNKVIFSSRQEIPMFKTLEQLQNWLLMR